MKQATVLNCKYEILFPNTFCNFNFQLKHWKRSNCFSLHRYIFKRPQRMWKHKRQHFEHNLLKCSHWVSLSFVYIKFFFIIFTEEQGWHSGESTCLPPMWHGFDSWTRCHMWVEFVVGSRPCSEGFFSRFSGFPPSTKTNISKFNSIWNPRATGLSVV